MLPSSNMQHIYIYVIKSAGRHNHNRASTMWFLMVWEIYEFMTSEHRQISRQCMPSDTHRTGGVNIIVANALAPWVAQDISIHEIAYVE